MIEVGDHVTVGKGDTHWVVVDTDAFGAFLRSGVTGIRRYWDFHCLTLFRKGSA